MSSRPSGVPRGNGSDLYAEALDAIGQTRFRTGVQARP